MEDLQYFKIFFLSKGYDRAPRSVASKILMCAWFGFIVVALIMYTGSMVNHMFWASSVQSQRIDHKPFKNLEELLMDETYEIGALVNSSTYWYISEVGRLTSDNSVLLLVALYVVCIIFPGETVKIATWM